MLSPRASQRGDRSEGGRGRRKGRRKRRGREGETRLTGGSNGTSFDVVICGPCSASTPVLWIGSIRTAVFMGASRRTEQALGASGNLCMTAGRGNVMRMVFLLDEQRHFSQVDENMNFARRGNKA